MSLATDYETEHVLKDEIVRNAVLATLPPAVFDRFSRSEGCRPEATRDYS